MIGNQRQTRKSLPALPFGALAARITRKIDLTVHWRLSMPLGTSLADIELGLARNSNKEDA